MTCDGGRPCRRNVRNHSIVRRFGHSQNVAERGRGNNFFFFKKPNFNFRILLFWRGWYGSFKNLYKIIHKSWGACSQFKHWQLSKDADDMPSPTPTPGEWTLALTVWFVTSCLDYISSCQRPHRPTTRYWSTRLGPDLLWFHLLSCSCTSDLAYRRRVRSVVRRTLDQLCAFLFFFFVFFKFWYHLQTQRCPFHVTAIDWLMNEDEEMRPGELCDGLTLKICRTHTLVSGPSVWYNIYDCAKSAFSSKEMNCVVVCCTDI